MLSGIPSPSESRSKLLIRPSLSLSISTIHIDTFVPDSAVTTELPGK